VAIHRLERKRIEELTRKPGKHADGAGLYLHVRRPGQASWSYQFRFNTATHWMNIGPAATFTLDEARERHHELRRLRDRGFDPRSEVAAAALPPYQLPAQQSAAPVVMASAPSGGPLFGEVVEMYLTEFGPSWRNGEQGKEAQAYRRQIIGTDFARLPVAAIETAHVEAAIKSYADTPATAERVLMRIGKILNYATAKKLRSGDNPARIRGHFEFLARPVVPATKHLEALLWSELPKLIRELSAIDLTEARALSFTIATAARTDETRGMKWSEIDHKNALWHVPGNRMKEGIAHSVPLAPAVLKLMGKPGAPAEFVFPGRRYGARKPMWSHAMLSVLKTLRPGYTVHGFRSTFRDWVAENGKYSHELGERALAHAVGTKVSSAYQRSKLIEQRRPLMGDWAKFAGLR
jgi:integrase